MSDSGWRSCASEPQLAPRGKGMRSVGITPKAAMSGRRTRAAMGAACAATAMLALPLRIEAQQAVFVRTLTELTVAIEGTFGDEGARVQPALDRLAAALEAWDREIDAAEASARAAVPKAQPSAGVDGRVTLGRMLADRGRLADALSHFDAAVGAAPQRGDVHLLRGLALREAGRSAEATAAFRTAQAVDPGNIVAAYHLFHHLAITGDAAAARDAAGSVAAAYERLPSAQTKRTPFARLALA